MAEEPAAKPKDHTTLDETTIEQVAHTRREYLDKLYAGSLRIMELGFEKNTPQGAKFLIGNEAAIMEIQQHIALCYDIDRVGKSSHQIASATGTYDPYAMAVTRDEIITRRAQESADADAFNPLPDSPTDADPPEP